MFITQVSILQKEIYFSGNAILSTVDFLKLYITMPRDVRKRRLQSAFASTGNEHAPVVKNRRRNIGNDSLMMDKKRKYV